MKYFMCAFILALSFVSQSQATVIKCSGQGKTLETQFVAAANGVYKADVYFGENGLSAQKLKGSIAIDVQFSPPGGVSVNHHVNSYSGVYSDGGNTIGFWLVQVFDLNGKYLFDFKNVFGMNTKALGDCKLSN